MDELSRTATTTRFMIIECKTPAGAASLPWRAWGIYDLCTNGAKRRSPPALRRRCQRQFEKFARLMGHSTFEMLPHKWQYKCGTSACGTSRINWVDCRVRGRAWTGWGRGWRSSSNARTRSHRCAARSGAAHVWNRQFKLMVMSTFIFRRDAAQVYWHSHFGASNPRHPRAVNVMCSTFFRSRSD